MDPVSNVDRLVFLLRQRLLERARSPAARKDARSATSLATPQPLDQLQALAGVDGIDDRHLRRALIQNILADKFGNGLVNDAKFQQVVERVTDAMAGDPETNLVLSHVIQQLRAEAR